MGDGRLNTRSLLEGVVYKGGRSQHGDYRRVREKEDRYWIDLKSVRQACAHGRSKKITLPTVPFNHKDDEA